MSKLFEIRWLTGFVLLLVFCAGFHLRYDNLQHWQANTDRYFFGPEQTPLMLTVDAYYYLDIAKEVQAGTYQAFDPHRQAPNGYERSASAPLLSVLLATLSRWSGQSLERTALIVSPVLGALLALPMYLLASALTVRVYSPHVSTAERQRWARLAGLVAAGFAVISPKLASRSSPGWFDTDNLNVFFPVLLAWLGMQLVDAQNGLRRLCYWVSFFTVFALFLWWWEQSAIPVLLFSGVPFAVAVIAIARRDFRELLPVAAMAALLIIVLGFWKGFGILNPSQYITQFKGMLGYITSDTTESVFFAAGDFVSEQRKTSWPLFARSSAGGAVACVLAGFGLLILIVYCRWYSLFLMALFLVALLSLSGQRFLIFTAPLFGLGIASLLVFVCYWLRAWYWRVPVAAALLTGSAWAALTVLQAQESMAPRRAPILFDAMRAINSVTEPDAVIWASWGHGHPMVHYAERATVGDGIYHPASLQYITDFPLATRDFRLAANWIQFYAAHGAEGMARANQLFGGSRRAWAEGVQALQTLLAVGVKRSRILLQKDYAVAADTLEDTLRFLYPTSKPVYVFLDYLLLEQPWFYLGRWDFQKRSGPRYMYLVVSNTQAQADGLTGLSRHGAVRIDLDDGRFNVKGRGNTLRRIHVHDGQQVIETVFQSHSRTVFNFLEPAHFGVIQGQETYGTVLNTLYFEIPLNNPYFSPATVQAPYYALWKVKGEHYQLLAGESHE